VAFDFRPRLEGQGTYRWYDLPRLKGPRHLWNHRSNWPPPSQNTLIVYKDGSVVEGDNFGPEDLDPSLVHRVFVGGYDHRVTAAEDFLSWQALKAAGYKCVVPTVDIYLPSDKHSDDYPLVDGVTDPAVLKGLTP
jgi:hypothetical protein